MLKSHKLKRLWAKIQFWELGIQIVKHGGTFLQLKKVNPKMGFIWRVKHGLSKDGIKKTKIDLILGRRTKREGEGEEEEEEEEDGGAKIKPRYGTLDFWYGNQP